MARLASLAALATLLAFAPTALAQQPARVSATVDRERTSLHEDIELSVSLEGTFDDYEVPRLDDFQIVQEGMTRVLSGRRSSITRNYTLRPRRAGTLNIGSARLLRGGQVVAESPPIAITVAEPAAVTPVSAAEAQNLARYVDEGVFIRMATPRTSYFVGEPFPLNLEVYFQVGWQVTGADLVQGPKLDGLLVEDLRDLDREQRMERVRVGATTLTTYPLIRQLATPLRPGRVLIDATTIRLGVSTGLLGSTRRYTRSTQPFWLEVREVPREGRPEGFDEGNLGRFELTATLLDDRGRSATRVPTGQRLVLRAEIEGEGNLLTVKPPRIAASAGFDVQPLPGGTEDTISRDERGMRGRRVFQYIVTPLEPGLNTAPQVQFVFFDPASGRFETRTGLGGRIEVTGERFDHEGSGAALSGEDVRPLFGVERARLEPRGRASLSSSPFYWGLLVLPFVLFLFVELRWRLADRDRRRPGERRARTAHANSKKRLRAAEQALRDRLVKDFYGQIARTLTAYLEERANIPATGMTHDEVRRASSEAGYPVALVERMIVEMENCDFARFAPHGSASDRMRETLDRAAALLGELDRHTPRRRP